MTFTDLRDFIEFLEQQGELKRISAEVDPHLEMTEICDRVLRAGGPALLFENPKGHDHAVLANLFGTPRRVALAMGREDTSALKEVGELLAFLKEPEPPSGFKDAIAKVPMFKQALNMPPKRVSKAPCQEIVFEGDQVDLTRLPVQHCWPGDAAPLVTWGLTITRGPNQKRQNLGIYRQQLLGKNQLIMRWLAHRGGALDYKDFQEQHPGERYPVAVALGADPVTILGAVTPVPDGMSEYAFAGLLRGERTKVVKALSNDLDVPATAEIVLEGYLEPGLEAPEGPYGDHTGYYNEVESFPVLTVTHVTMRRDAIYHSTYTGRPPDEPAMLGVALNEVFVPILRKQYPEILDFYLPPEGCSYRMAVISIKKQYAGHAKRVMMGAWSFLRQFMYTKFIVVVDEDINPRDWNEVIWAMTTRMDPKRDTLMVDNTPIDYLDFASPVAGLGSKMGLDATRKWGAETRYQAIEPATPTLAPAPEHWAELVAALQAQFPEIRAIHLPSEAYAGRMLVLTIEKTYAGQGKRVMVGAWNFLRQHRYTNTILVCDHDIDPASWEDVIWAITTRMDPIRDTVMVDNGLSLPPGEDTPEEGLGSKMGLDATNKWPGETDREWGEPIVMDGAIKDRVSQRWAELGLGQ